ncbi:hypothetical protein Saso_13740 [Streptomyces asoensis]|uniref:Uncharacterized protein n=1 Tax=Streptomyces asoensis TaxID=249586 RepID=A0ABQ3RV31_9ACTN|nr:hypothetical protein GCM10010496_66800 [Streptomyces asoensis]GHI59724.1 hypothetical protein Saso_13740 [Streptomyces asoensis]
MTAPPQGLRSRPSALPADAPAAEVLDAEGPVAASADVVDAGVADAAPAGAAPAGAAPAGAADAGVADAGDAAAKADVPDAEDLTPRSRRPRARARGASTVPPAPRRVSVLRRRDGVGTRPARTCRAPCGPARPHVPGAAGSSCLAVHAVHCGFPHWLCSTCVVGSASSGARRAPCGPA